MNVRQSPEPDHQGQAAESPDQDQDQAPDLGQDHAPDLAQDLVAEVQLARTTLSNDPPPSTSKGAKKEVQDVCKSQKFTKVTISPQVSYFLTAKLSLGINEITSLSNQFLAAKSLKISDEIIRNSGENIRFVTAKSYIILAAKS